MTEKSNAPLVQSDSIQTTLAKSDDNLVWIDCEMTGLDPEKERLLEIAVVVTGPNLSPRIEGPVCVIHQNDELLKANESLHQELTKLKEMSSFFKEKCRRDL